MATCGICHDTGVVEIGELDSCDHRLVACTVGGGSVLDAPSRTQEVLCALAASVPSVSRGGLISSQDVPSAR